MPAKIYVATTGISPACSQRKFSVVFFSFIFIYSISKKVGRMAEQLEKLQVEKGEGGEK